MTSLLAHLRKAFHDLFVPVKFCAWCDRQNGDHYESGLCIFSDCECRGCR